LYHRLPLPRPRCMISLCRVRVEKLRMYRVLACLLSLLLAPVLVQAHGSVTAGADLCIIRIGFYTAHFKVYQPERSGHREFCEDLPASGETLFVMEYLHESLGAVPLEFRILSNPTGLGRFTRLDDLPAAAELEALTLFHQGPATAPDVLTARHVFAEEGDYIGVVTARHPSTQEEYLAVFPFEVGRSSWGLAPLLLGILLLAQLGYWWSRGSLLQWRQRWRTPSLLMLLLVLGSAESLRAATDEAGFVSSQSGSFRVQFVSDVQPLPLNVMHAWTLRLQSAEGEPLSGAELTLVGGMPAHDHGLPSAPQVQPMAEPGFYRVEGLRFHMQGEWVLELTVQHDGREDRASLTVKL
jgi:hypothetical protein